MKLLIILASLFIGNVFLFSASAQDSIEAIRAVPKRIILGALSYGAKDDKILTIQLTLSGLDPKYSFTAIDLTHADGVSMLSRSNENEKSTFNLSVSTKEFSANQPFGKFIKKVIRIETNCPSEPQIIIPIIGWNSINSTTRDFSQYLFHGNLRWQGIWGTPNLAGGILAPLTLILLGVTFWILGTTFKRIPFLKVFSVLVLAGACLTLMILLGLTYSRGSWLAFTAGIISMVGLLPDSRKLSFATLLIFGVILIIVPSGLARVSSYTSISEDLSIANRIKLWTGALQIMAEYPVCGIGSGNFGPVFQKDYQTFDHIENNSTAVSDYLTFGAEYGILSLGIIVGLLSALILKCFKIKLARFIIGVPTSALIAMAVASFFSSLSCFFQFELLAILLIIFLSITLFIFLLFEKNQVQLCITECILVVKCILASAITIYFLALLTLLWLPTTTTHQTFPEFDKIDVEIVQPRWNVSKGIIVYISTDDGILLYHSTIRPLAAQGWTVIGFHATSTDDLPQLLNLISSLNKDMPNQNVFVAGDGLGGRLAWLLATLEPKPLLHAGAGFGFLANDLAPENGGVPIKIPFLVYHDLFDSEVPANPTICANEKRSFNNLPITIILSKNDGGHFSHDWQSWLTSVTHSFASRQ